MHAAMAGVRNGGEALVCPAVSFLFARVRVLGFLDMRFRVGFSPPSKMLSLLPKHLIYALDRHLIPLINIEVLDF